MIIHNGRLHEYQNHLTYIFICRLFSIHLESSGQKIHVATTHTPNISISIIIYSYNPRCKGHIAAGNHKNEICAVLIFNCGSFIKMNLLKCPTLSLLIAFNGLSTQEGIICILGSKSLFYYTIRMEEEISTWIEKTLTMVH